MYCNPYSINCMVYILVRTHCNIMPPRDHWDKHHLCMLGKTCAVAACHASGCVLWCDCWLWCIAGWAPGGEEATGGAEEGGAAQAGSLQVSPGSGSLGSHHCHRAVLCCFVCCVVFFLALQWISVIDVASDDTISRPLQRKRPMSDPLLTYNYHWSLRKLHFLLAEKGKTEQISHKYQGKREDRRHEVHLWLPSLCKKRISWEDVFEGAVYFNKFGWLANKKESSSCTVVV